MRTVPAIIVKKQVHIRIKFSHDGNFLPAKSETKQQPKKQIGKHREYNIVLPIFARTDGILLQKRSQALRGTDAQEYRCCLPTLARFIRSPCTEPDCNPMVAFKRIGCQTEMQAIGNRMPAFVTVGFGFHCFLQITTVRNRCRTGSRNAFFGFCDKRLYRK